ncbi:MAG: hypothetical protein ACRD0V_15370 [Acidimicrobiales bacterium]
MSGRATAKDYGWVSVAAVASLMFIFGLSNAVWAIVDGRWVVLAAAPVGLVFGYWIIAGCWRRIMWGRP